LRWTLSVIALTVATLTGVAYERVMHANQALSEIISDFRSQRQDFSDLRLTMDRAYLTNRGNTKLRAAVREKLTSMQKKNHDRFWIKDLESGETWLNELDFLTQEFISAETKQNAEQLRSIETKLTQKVAEVRAKIDLVYLQIGNQRVSQLSQVLTTIGKILILVAIFAVFFPAMIIWWAVRKVNSEISKKLKQLNQFSSENSKMTSEIRSASNELSDASETQLGATQDAVESIAEIRGKIDLALSHVREIQELTGFMERTSRDGRSTMMRMQKSMQTIKDSNQKLQTIEDIIQSVRGKTRIINDIVFKTQLLSFNASIEAARAGQYGRGFAVVAEEVGKLAQVSGMASQEIDQLLTDSESRVSSIVGDLESRVSDGLNVSSEALQSFSDITNQISTLANKIIEMGQIALDQGEFSSKAVSTIELMNSTAHRGKTNAESIRMISQKTADLSLALESITNDLRGYLGRAGSVTTHQTPQNAVIVPFATTKVSLSKTSLASIPKSKDATAANLVQKYEFEGLSADDPSFRKPNNPS